MSVTIPPVNFTIPPHIARNLAVFADWRKSARSPLYGELHIRTIEDDGPGHVEFFTCWNGRHLARYRAYAGGYAGGDVHNAYTILPAEEWLHAKRGDEPRISSEGLHHDLTWSTVAPANHFCRLWDHWSRVQQTPTPNGYRIENTEDLTLFGQLRNDKGDQTQVSFDPIAINVSRFGTTCGIRGFTTSNTRLPWLEGAPL